MFERHNAVMLLIEPVTGKILDANKAAERFYGYTKSRLLSMSIQDINVLPPEEVAAQRNLALKEDRNYFIFLHRLANGEVRTVEVYSAPIEENGSKVLFSIIHDITERKLLEQDKESVIVELQKALSEVKQLKQFLPICASCKKIRDDEGYWSEIERYIGEHTDTQFSHGICPDCMRKLYPEYAEEILECSKNEDK
jgi:PAS domain S-box-containing protein